MMGFKPDETTLRNNHNGHKSNTIQDQSAPLTDELTTDAAAWRAEHADTARGIERRLVAALRYWRAASDDFHVSVLSATDHAQDEVQVDTEEESNSLPDIATAIAPYSMPNSSIPAITKLPQRRRFSWGAATLAAAVLIGLVSTFFALRGAHGALAGWGISSGAMTPIPSVTGTTQPGPITMTVLNTNVSATDPRLYILANIRFTTCLRDPGATGDMGAPPQTIIMTIVYQQSNFATAYVHMTCRSGSQPIAIIALDQFGGFWNFDYGTIANDPAGTQSFAPPLLVVPMENYSSSMDVFSSPDAQTSSFNLMYWVANNRGYLIAQYSHSAAKPADATPIMVNGRSGWVTQADGFVTVTEPLSDGSTIFFSGTGSLYDGEQRGITALENLSYLGFVTLSQSRSAPATPTPRPGQQPTYWGVAIK